MKKTIKDKLTNLTRIVLGTIAVLGLLYGAFVAFSGGAALNPNNIEAALNQAKEESLPAPPTGEPITITITPASTNDLPAPPTGEPQIICGDHSIYDCSNGHITERTK